MTCKAGDTRPKTTDQGGGLGSLVFPHQLSPAVHLPLNLIPDRDVLKFTPPRDPTLLATLVKDLVATAADYQKRPSAKNFQRNVQSPCKSPTDRWNWAERQVPVIYWKPLMAGWLLEF